jgi:hypothetical protein
LSRKMSHLFLIVTLLLAIGAIEFLHFGNHTLNASAVETTANIGIYWDNECSMRVYSIDWGVLTPGQTKEVTVYVRNEGNETCLLILSPENWNPDNAPNYLGFSCGCKDNRIGVGEIVKGTLSLLVSSNIVGITSFSFDIIFEGRTYFLCDVNRDGVVDLKDYYIVCLAYASNPNDSNWNPDADLNKDSVVDLKDVYIIAKEFG